MWCPLSLPHWEGPEISSSVQSSTVPLSVFPEDTSRPSQGPCMHITLTASDISPLCLKETQVLLQLPASQISRAGQQWIFPQPKHLFCLIKHMQHVLSCRWVQQSPPHLGGRAEQQHCQFWWVSVSDISSIAQPRCAQ